MRFVSLSYLEFILNIIQNKFCEIIICVALPVCPFSHIFIVWYWFSLWSKNALAHLTLCFSCQCPVSVHRNSVAYIFPTTGIVSFLCLPTYVSGVCAGDRSMIKEYGTAKNHTGIWKISYLHPISAPGDSTSTPCHWLRRCL